MNKLYIIATPIGNLGDMTFRAVEILKEVDLILCEDTRRTKKLLDHYEIKKPTLSYHQRSKLSRVDKIIDELKNGKDLALVTDAGTPGISDPGNELIELILMELGEEVEIVPIPGASAITALASVAGINMNKFSFLGFPPNKKGRNKFFQNVLAETKPVVYYESPYRIVRNLDLLQELVSENSDDPNSKTTLNHKNFNFIVGRELTKAHEEVVRGDLSKIIKHYEDNPDKIKGEFVVIVY